jgi:DNA-binding transcriptional LysR family regulator
LATFTYADISVNGGADGKLDAVPGSSPAGSLLERQVTLQQLRIFKSVVDHHNFTRAAEALFLTQPAVTHQIQALARTMGQPLFTGRGPAGLTAVGEVVYEKACRILADLRELDEAVDNVDRLRAGSLRIAGDVTFGTYILPRAVSAFHAIHPNIEVHMAVSQGSTIRDRLLHHDADLGVVGRLWDDSRIGAQAVIENVVACYCSPSHHLAHRTPVALEELADRTLLVREAGSGLSDGVMRLFADASVRMRPAMEITDNEARKRAAVEGLGVAVLSTFAVRSELAVGLLVPLQAEGFPLHLMWHAVWLGDRELSSAARAFKEFLCSEAWGSEPTSAAPHEILVAPEPELADA